MASLDYSTDALNVTNRFYKCNILVYVEGVDDIPFWRSVFESMSSENFEFEELGGCNEIERYALRLEQEQLNYLIARDSDYLKELNKKSNSPQVIYSHGYSIENSIYVSKVISKISGIFNRKSHVDEQSVNSWMSKFCSDIEELVKHDLANSIAESNISVLGDNCSRFMEDHEPASVSSVKVSEYIRTKLKSIRQQDLISAKTRFNANGGYSINNVKGHFLSSAVLRYISSFAEKSISAEALYASAISSLNWDEPWQHPHRPYYEHEVERAVQAALG